MLRSHGQRSSSFKGVPAAIFVHVGLGVERVSLGVRPAQHRRQALGHRRLADAGDTHDHDYLRLMRPDSWQVTVLASPDPATPLDDIMRARAIRGPLDWSSGRA